MKSIRLISLALVSAFLLSGCTPGCPATPPDESSDVATFEGREGEDSEPASVRERHLREPVPSEVSTSDLL